ncbi:hypothetical protein F383_23817 [Gossypium arboreum]|uniref:Uncharacterized protein n=1 Tax=Gossypium arboreum TaxID=29729 RepID=A0A0B0NZD8_GOSAR|nr:hypothetical protein F383_23817 [Gossypium arboreum]
MEKPDSTSGCGCSDVYHSIFIDSNLDTHLAMIVSDSETVSDLKKKILYEHPLCFPNIGEIKINALKVKRKGFLYHLSDSMFVKSAFGGVSRSWFLSVDASSAKEHRENHNSIEPDAGNIVACFGTGINNYSVDVVDLLPVDKAKRLSNVNDAPLLQDRDDCHAKQNSASQQFGFSNSTKENSGNLCKEAEHTADSNNQVSLPATNTGSRPKVQSKDVGDDKISEDLQASVATSVLKEKQKTKKRNKYAIHHDSKENGALVVESGKDALDSGHVLEENLIHNGQSLALNDANLGNQIHVDEASRSLSSDRNKRSTARKRMADGGINVPGEHSELETNKHKDVAHKDQEHESKEDSFQSRPASKKKRKAKKKDVNDNSLIENVEQAIDLNTTSVCTLGQKLENTRAVVDPLNTESVKQNHLLTANANGGKKNRKRQKSNPSQGGSDVSSAKDVHVETFQAVEAIKDKDLGSKGDPEVSETNQVPQRNKYAIHHDSKENGALVVESGKDALDSGRVLEENLIHNGPSLALNDANLGSQIHVDETSRSLSSDRNKRSTARKKMADGGINVPGEHSELETNKHKDVAHKDQEHESKEDSFQSRPASKKKRKAKKKDVNDNSLIENVEQAIDLNTTSVCTLGQKLENTRAVVDPLNTESVKQNHLLTANANGGKKNRKRQKSNPSQGGSDVSSAKDVHVETFQAVEAIKDKDLGSKGDPEVSETNQVPQRNKYAIHHDSKENGALVVESGKDALDSGRVLEENLIHNGPSLALNDANLGSQIHVDETSRSLSSDRNKRSTARKKMADGGINVPGEHSELETNKHKDVAHKDQEHESKEDSFQSRPASKKKRKAKKKDVNDNSLIENVEQAIDLNTTSVCTLGQKLENTRAVVDPLNTESVKQNHLLTANANGGKKNRKRQKSNPSQGGSDVSSAKDVHVETFQAVEAIKDKDLGSKGDPEVSETNQVPQRNKYAIHHDSKENGALVVESGKDALDSGRVLEENLIHNGPSLALNDANLGSQIHVDETSRSLSSDRNKRSTARKRMADGGINVPGEHSELETNKHKDVAHKDQEHESKEDSFQSRPASKKKRKAKKKDVRNWKIRGLS